MGRRPGFYSNDVYRHRLRGSRCVYCGETATTDDHFPPASFSNEGFILPCCSECNSLAGILWPCDFERRAEAVKQGLRRKYRKYLQTPDWAPDEIAELGHNLRGTVQSCQIAKDLVKQRIAWNVVSYLASIDHSNRFVPIVAEESDSIAAARKWLPPTKP